MTDLQAGALLLGIVVLAWALMWWGWRRRAGRHQLPPLVPVPAEAGAPVLLAAAGRYFGTTVADHWLERVSARGLGTRSEVQLRLTEDGLDVERPTTSFRIPRSALRCARHDQGIAGKVVPPHGLLVVTWQHGDLRLDTGFRLGDETTEAHGTTRTHDQWVTTIDQLATRQEDV